MKKYVIILALALSSSAFAAGKVTFAGSDTLAGAIGDAIIASGLQEQIQYLGGGSGTGEKNLVAGDQGIAPMSRQINPAALKTITDAGSNVTAHVLALDGLSMFVKNTATITSLDLPTIVRIYTCEYTNWSQVAGSGMTGTINVYRRNDESGTTDAFKNFTGVKTFGKCVKAVAETADISDLTSRDASAIGYAGLSGKVEGNRALAIAAKAGGKAVLPTTATIRDFSYPMSRYLYVYEINGARKPNAAEAALLTYITDRSFMDPIMQAHEFITID